MLCLWAMSAAFMLGYPVCFLGLILQPLGAAAGWLLGWLPRYVIAVVRIIARLPWAVICTRNHLGVWWLVFVYVVFGLSLLRWGGERWRPILPLSLSVAALALASIFSFRTLQGAAELSALDVGQGQCLAVLTDDASVLIDCGGIMSPGNAGDTAADFLLESGRRSVDLLLLTHFHEDHANGVERLFNRMDVKRLAYPMDCEQNEISDTILALCALRGVELLPISADCEVTVGKLSLLLIAPLGSGDANERCMLVRGTCGDDDFLVTGDVGSSAERQLCSLYDLEDTELLVAGHHGSKNATCDKLLDELAVKTALISVGAGNTYGHPTQEVLDRLARRGVDVHRTDTEGTITLLIGN